MYAWPADSLMHMVIKLSRYNSFKLTIFNFIFYLKTMKMATKVYNMDWYGKDIRTQRKILFIILRSQKYESFGINGIVPALSLSYYGKVLCYSIFLFVIIVIIWLLDFFVFISLLFCSIYTRLCHISMHYLLWLKILSTSQLSCQLSWNSMMGKRYIWKMYVYTCIRFSISYFTYFLLSCLFYTCLSYMYNAINNYYRRLNYLETLET